MKKLTAAAFFACFALGIAGAAHAGGGEELTEAPVYDEVLNQISMREAELLWQAKVPFYDVNTLDVRTKGFIPGSVYFNVKDWKKLLPEDKNQTMVFYCANRLCTNSEMAAREVMKLGYTDVRQMPDGIHGWGLSGRPMERP
jgi:rhodanese-related sulfurtransferase